MELSATPATLQETDALGPLESASIPSITAGERQGPIVIDGVLDEEAWSGALPTSDFVAGTPVEGVPARHQTEVRILFDAEALYVAARMWDSDPASIRRQLTRRDEEAESYDYVEVAFDPVLDHRTAYAFRLTAAGVQVDRFRYDDVEVDGAWQAVWEGAAAIDEEGWTAEFRIPLSQLRFDPSPHPQNWGLNVSRRNVSEGEISYLALESRQRSEGVSAFAVLDGLVLPDRPRSLELRPFLLTGYETMTNPNGDPFRDRNAASGQVGLDGRYALGSTFVADFTVNPDFGQVEVDPAVVNLTAQETFFPEQRPFFTRDDRIFDFSLPGPGNNVFHPRRIGRSPRGGPPPGAAFSDVPGETPILGAGKLTGRTQGGRSVGALFALTSRVDGRTFSEEGVGVDRFLAEPPARFGVLRFQQDLTEGDSQVGALLTHVSRPVREAGDLPTSAHAAGIDFQHRWSNREWSLTGHIVGSHVRGSPKAMTRIQESSVHYFQRPDAVHLGVDSAATSLSAAHWHLNLSRRGGSPFTGSVFMGHRTPGFEVNDAGFSTSQERLYGGTRLGYQSIVPGALFREYELSLTIIQSVRNSLFSARVHERRWEDAYAGGRASANSEFTFLNFWTAEARVSYSPPRLDDRATRGGPLMHQPGGVGWALAVGTDVRSALSATVGAEYEDSGRGGDELELSAGVVYRPSTSMQVEVSPIFTRAFDPSQYVGRMQDPDYLPTFGTRYFFADLELRTLAVGTRVSMVFSPSLTLEVFAQPLLSSGDFLTYKALERARTFSFVEFPDGEAVTEPEGMRCVGGRSCLKDGMRHLDLDGNGWADHAVPQQSFNLRSLQGNAVLRWEYRPGSQLFLVWQQSRRDRATLGDFSLHRDTRALLTAPTENHFMVKVNYWLGL